MTRLGFKLLSALVQIDLVPPETESFASLSKRYDLHTQNRVVEMARFLNIGYGENKVINMKNFHSGMSQVSCSALWFSPGPGSHFLEPAMY
jgi:hypothetical protein